VLARTSCHATSPAWRQTKAGGRGKIARARTGRSHVGRLWLSSSAAWWCRQPYVAARSVPSERAPRSTVTAGPGPLEPPPGGANPRTRRPVGKGAPAGFLAGELGHRYGDIITLCLGSPSERGCERGEVEAPGPGHPGQHLWGGKSARVPTVRIGASRGCATFSNCSVQAHVWVGPPARSRRKGRVYPDVKCPICPLICACPFRVSPAL
jgi:hypothetical protein